MEWKKLNLKELFKMKALVCEKKSFESKGSKYYTLTLCSYNQYFNDYRIETRKDSNGSYVPQVRFVDAALYEEIEIGKWYDFIFGVDTETGRSKLSDASLLK